MVSNNVLWSRFYFICLGVRLICLPFAAWSFWGYQEDVRQPRLTVVEATEDRQESAEPQSGLQNLKLALKNRVTIFGALFIFAYQGAEVAISGWVISFLINYRAGNPAQVGYVTSGFWVSHLSPFTSSRCTTNVRKGGYHARSLHLDSPRSPRGREKVHHYTHIWLRRATTHGLAHPQRCWQCSRSCFPRFPPRTGISLRADYLRASHPTPCSDDSDRVHWRGRQFRRSGCPVHNWYLGSGSRNLGAAPGMYRSLCYGTGVLVQSTERAEEDRVVDHDGGGRCIRSESSYSIYVLASISVAF